jgi:ATP-dependent exoDNAse (exonuclease V) alpha subunit
MTFDLTACQAVAAPGLVEWSHSDSLFATLTGAAGTGKTTLLGHVLPLLKQRFGVVVTAPTHQAKLQIALKTRKEAYTIQALAGLKPQVDLEVFNPNDLQYTATGKEQIQYVKLLIIDEASMLNDGLFDYLCTLARQYNVKVLFVGDKFQLKPIGQDTAAKPFDKDYVDCIFTLSEVVRQANASPIAIPLGALRNDLSYIMDGHISTIEMENFMRAVDTHYDGEIHLASPFKAFRWVIDNLPSMSNQDGKYLITRDFKRFATELAEDFRSEDFSDDPFHVKALAFTNTNVSAFNKQIRKYLHGETAEMFIKGDLLTGYKTIVSDQQEILINSKVYTIIGVKEVQSVGSVNCYELLISSIDDGLTSTVYIVKPESYPDFIIYQQTAFNNKKLGPYLDDMKRFQCMESLNTVYPNDLEIEIEGLSCVAYSKFLPKKTIDYGYACTIHKAQGSTYDNIYLDGANVIKYTRQDLDTMYRLLYVGLSRAATKAVLYI